MTAERSKPAVVLIAGAGAALHLLGGIAVIFWALKVQGRSPATPFTIMGGVALLTASTAYFFRVPFMPSLLAMAARAITLYALLIVLGRITVPESDTPLALGSRIGLAVLELLSSIAWSSAALDAWYRRGTEDSGGLPARRTSVGQPFLISLFLLPFLAMGGCFVETSYRARAEEMAFENRALKTTGRIESVVREYQENSRDLEGYKIRFSYDVNGRRYESDRYGSSARSLAPPSSNLRVGEEVGITYDPLDPARAMLWAGSEGSGLALISGYVLLLLGCEMLIWVWRSWRKGTLNFVLSPGD